MSQRYSENYIAVCHEVEASASDLLGRALTKREKLAIWGAGTLTWLEMRVQVPMQQAQSPDDLADLLVGAADDLDGRLPEMIESLDGMLVALLDRDLAAAERQQLQRLHDVVAVMQFGEEVAIAVPDVREAVLHDLLNRL